MRIGRIIGSITLTEAHPTMRGGVLRLLVPLRAEDLDNEDGPSPELVAWDERGAGNGQLVAFSEGGEAAQRFNRKESRSMPTFQPLLIRLTVPTESNHENRIITEPTPTQNMRKT